MSDYYNENDPYAAQTLRNLVAAGHIPDGVVDERSIEDVRPVELMQYRRCHFFAGIGVWALALANADWPADRRVWTGSCPCQPFSAAGKGDAFDDKRHLWPAWFHLIEQCRPATVFGEQVASTDAMPWLDLVQADMEGLGHAFGALPFPASSVGAPHIRDRLYWVGHADHNGSRRNAGTIPGTQRSLERGMWGVSDRTQSSGPTSQLGNPECQGLALGIGIGGAPCEPAGADERQATERTGVHAGELADTQRDDRRCEATAADHLRSQTDGPANRPSGRGRTSSWLVNTDGRNPGTERQQRSREQQQQPQDGDAVRLESAGPTNGVWRSADWLWCRDERWRPVEPGSFPLAYGLPIGVGALDARMAGLASMAGLDGPSLRRAKSFRIGALKAFGNAIVEPQAREFIRAFLDSGY